MTMQTY